MTDFKIRRGLASQLTDPRLTLEEGCWYLCTDTAELFLCVNAGSKLELKRINSTNSPVIDPDTGVIAITRIEINNDGELVVYYANGDSQSIGKVLSSEEVLAGIKIGSNEPIFPVNGVIELPDLAEKSYVDTIVEQRLAGLATQAFVEEKIAAAQLSGGNVDLSQYITKSNIHEHIPQEYITEDELDTMLSTIVLHGGTA
jgi:hypothetical protein